MLNIFNKIELFMIKSKIVYKMTDVFKTQDIISIDNNNIILNFPNEKMYLNLNLRMKIFITLKLIDIVVDVIQFQPKDFMEIKDHGVHYPEKLQLIAFK